MPGEESTAISEPTRSAFELCAMAAAHPSRRSITRAMRSVFRTMTMAPAHSAERPELLIRYSILTQLRYEQFGRRARDLTVAIRSAGDAVRQIPPDHPQQPFYRAVLGLSLWLEHVRTGKRSHLDEAMAYLRQAVDATDPGHPRWAFFAGNLATVLSGHFRATGDLSSRDEAIQISRQIADTGDGDAVMASANLAVMLRRRYESHGRRADLDDSVKLLREASGSMEVGHPHRAALLTNTALAATRRGDLDEAVRVAEQAVTAAYHDREIHPLALTALAGALHDRFVAGGSPADLGRAVAVALESLGRTRHRDPARPRRAGQLAQIYLTKFHATGRTRWLHAPARLLRYAAQRTKDGPESAEFLVELGRALHTTALHYHARRSRRLAARAARRSVDAFRLATAVRGVPAQVHVTAARNWAVFASALGLPEADEAFEQFVEGLFLLTWPGIERSARELSLTDWRSEIKRAPAHFLDRNNPGEAVRSLDQSRALLWARTVHLRTDLSQLAAAHPELAARLSAIRAELDRPV
ncbi:hypothetical protein [Actinoplanes xinjiangensis]|uniref:hypothetical protein n=1 Tax=Actinoplanes xinjiangensis TaxID=512350 RepID=UPI00343092E4